MNGLRRALLIVYSLLLVAAAGGLIALTWNDSQKLDLEVGSFNLQAFVAASDNAKLAATAAFAAVGLVGVLSLLVALQRQSGGSHGALRLKQAEGGSVDVSATALERLLRDELMRVSEIRDVAPKVRVAGGSVQSDITVTIEPSTNIAHITNTIASVTNQALREQVGVTSVRRPHVRILYEEMLARPPGASVSPRAMPQRAIATPRPATYPPSPSPSLFEDRPAGEAKPPDTVEHE